MPTYNHELQIKNVYAFEKAPHLFPGEPWHYGIRIRHELAGHVSWIFRPAPLLAYIFLLPSRQLYVSALRVSRPRATQGAQQDTMSSIVAQIDAGLSYVASLVDRPEIDYESVVVYSSWAVTAFELYFL